MKIDFHSERFKKIVVWLMAIVLLPAFLLGGWFTGLFSGRPASTQYHVTVFGNKIDQQKYISFEMRWPQMIVYAADVRKKIDSLTGMAPYYRSLEVYLRYVLTRPDLAPYSIDYFFRYGMFPPPYDFHGALFSELFDWVPQKQRNLVLGGTGEDETARRQAVLEVTENLFARFIEAERLGLVPSAVEVSQIISRWFTVAAPDEEPAFNQQAYGDFLRRISDLRRDFDVNAASQEFHQTLAEFIALLRLEEMFNPFWDRVNISPLEQAKIFIEKSQQRMLDFFVVDVDSYMEEAQLKIASRPPEVTDDKLEKLYIEQEKKYRQPRRIAGDYILIDMAALDAMITQQVKASLQPPDEKALQEYYDLHKEDYRKPAPQAAEPPAPGAETPPAAEPPAPAATPPAPAEKEYRPFEEVKDEIRKTLEDDAFKKAFDEARDKWLAALYVEVQDQLAAARKVDADAIARAILNDVSLGNVFEKLAAFGKALLQETNRAQLLPDLKPVAERHKEEVSLHSVDVPISDQQALEWENIGGTDFAALFDDTKLYTELDRYPFLVRPSPPESGKRRVATCLLSGILSSTDDKHRFIFRIKDVEEPHLIPFKEIAASVKDELRKEFHQASIEKEARRILDADSGKWLIEIPDNKFDFEKIAEDVFKKKEKYEAAQKAALAPPVGAPADTAEIKPSTGPYFQTTPYVDRAAGSVEGVPAFRTADFISEAFSLAEGGSEVKIAGSIAGSVNSDSLVNKSRDLVVILRLTRKDKPIRKPSFKEFVEQRLVTAGGPSGPTIESRIEARYNYFRANITVVRPTAPPTGGGGEAPVDEDQ